MDLSIRLKAIVNMIEKCDSVIDVGTDHGYVPIYLVKNGVIKSAIASDINKGPVEKARNNITLNNLSAQISCRLGSGLSTVNNGEAQIAIIAGMGGNLIRDILEADLDLVKQFKYMILQPVQNAEVLREYLYITGYNIIDEEICNDDGKFYEIIKVKYDTKPIILDSIYYEISKILLDKKDPVMQRFIEYKMQKYSKVYDSLNDETILSKNRKMELYHVIKRLKGFLKCF
ncbi:class I SAM-dependent methyltransferase [Clostridium tagluense]|uniref:tRNA (adenine(22)-N(1))-methyltransferase n=1 Tax=Clostridium tagluense TaxID=360422 RepID=UPI001C0D79ED|nr:class I SAM-dependent methyltransferase [Clostridium tagluense]MBU3128473.1 class I SAM-dependent methyltransferase [Clostridium tagluense]MCB2310090.1 class I SAM-dependent methyltransferase [Clostridium tagluense]MCB2314380.1 class I SAM-dependent methyltransferase [Clostridium tagluense]MCB2319226.1 class I SAM-dependent methyltransferase [Clostridium tagluense]MCB2324684.1 class I SAM-dependent methyltransferase [Clostridium tagluense]